MVLFSRADIKLALCSPSLTFGTNPLAMHNELNPIALQLYGHNGIVWSLL